MANVKKIVKSAQKAAKMAKRINNTTMNKTPWGPAPRAKVSSKGKLKVFELNTSAPIKGKMKNIKKNAMLTEHKIFYGTSNTKNLKLPKKISRNVTNSPFSPKVPVKKRGK